MGVRFSFLGGGCGVVVDQQVHLRIWDTKRLFGNRSVDILIFLFSINSFPLFLFRKYYVYILFCEITFSCACKTSPSSVLGVTRGFLKEHITTSFLVKLCGTLSHPQLKYAFSIMQEIKTNVESNVNTFKAKKMLYKNKVLNFVWDIISPAVFHLLDGCSWPEPANFGLLTLWE